MNDEIELDKYQLVNTPKVKKGEVVEFYEYRNGYLYNGVALSTPYDETVFLSSNVNILFLDGIVDGKKHFLTLDEYRWLFGYDTTYVSSESFLELKECITS